MHLVMFYGVFLFVCFLNLLSAAVREALVLPEGQIRNDQEVFLPSGHSGSEAVALQRTLH